MGQGTLTGLAQLVVEELEGDWSKVTTEYPTPGQNLARNRVWQSYSTGGSRGIRESNEYVRKGGAAAREMLIQAAANDWGVPASECKAAKSVITHTPSGRTTTYGKVAEAAGKLEPPKDIKLKDPKDWTIAGKPLARLDTAEKLTGKQIYGTDLKLPGMLNAAIKDCPVFGGKVKRFDAAKVQGMPGVKKVVQVGDSAVAVVADTWWRAKTALDALPIVWDEGPNAKLSSDGIAQWLKEGLDATDSVFVGNQAGDVKARARDRREEGRGGLQLPLPEPRHHGADERHGAVDARQMRGLDADPERRGGACRGGRGLRPADRQVRRLQAPSRRRLRPARRLPRLRPPGGRDRQADAGHADQADLDPRGGHDARGLPPRDAVQARRRPRRQGQPDGAAHAHLRPVDPGRACARQGCRTARDPVVFQGLNAARARGVARLHGAEPPDRPRDAQPAGAAGLLARRQPEPERDLSSNASWTSSPMRPARIRSSSGAS